MAIILGVGVELGIINKAGYRELTSYLAVEIALGIVMIFQYSQ